MLFVRTKHIALGLSSQHFAPAQKLPKRVTTIFFFNFPHNYKNMFPRSGQVNSHFLSFHLYKRFKTVVKGDFENRTSSLMHIPTKTSPTSTSTLHPSPSFVQTRKENTGKYSQVCWKESSKSGNYESKSIIKGPESRAVSVPLSTLMGFELKRLCRSGAFSMFPRGLPDVFLELVTKQERTQLLVPEPVSQLAYQLSFRYRNIS